MKNTKKAIGLVIALILLFLGIIITIFALTNRKPSGDENSALEATGPNSKNIREELYKEEEYSETDLLEKNRETDLGEETGGETQKQVEAKEQITIVESGERVLIEEEEVPEDSCLVVFSDYDGCILKKCEIKKGESAIPPTSPKRDGYVFSGWSDSYTNVQVSLVVYAQYVEKTGVFLNVDKVTVSSGTKTVSVPITIKDNPGVLGLILEVEYDDRLKLKEVNCGTAFLEVLNLTCSKDLSSGCKFVWDGMELTKDNIKDGEILVLSFEIPKNLPVGEYPISIICNDGEAIDKDLKPIHLGINEGAIVIK